MAIRQIAYYHNPQRQAENAPPTSLAASQPGGWNRCRVAEAALLPGSQLLGRRSVPQTRPDAGPSRTSATRAGPGPGSCHLAQAGENCPASPPDPFSGLIPKPAQSVPVDQRYLPSPKPHQRHSSAPSGSHVARAAASHSHLKAQPPAVLHLPVEKALLAQRGHDVATAVPDTRRKTPPLAHMACCSRGTDSLSPDPSYTLKPHPMTNTVQMGSSSTAMNR
jgi:hypothetical protein